MPDSPPAGEPGQSPAVARRVVIEFEPGPEIAGSVADETGPPTEFRGRLELYAAIERARESG